MCVTSILHTESGKSWKYMEFKSKKIPNLGFCGVRPWSGKSLGKIFWSPGIFTKANCVPVSNLNKSTNSLLCPLVCL